MPWERRDSTGRSPSSYCPTTEKQLQYGGNEEKMGKERKKELVNHCIFICAALFCPSGGEHVWVKINCRKSDVFENSTKEALDSDLDTRVVKVWKAHLRENKSSDSVRASLFFLEVLILMNLSLRHTAQEGLWVLCVVAGNYWGGFCDTRTEAKTHTGNEDGG